MLGVVDAGKSHRMSARTSSRMANQKRISTSDLLAFDGTPFQSLPP
jgi:hypothetical protein